MLDMLSIVSYNLRYLLTWTDFSLWTTKIYFFNTSFVLKLCTEVVWFTDNFPYTNVTRVKIKAMCWSQITTDNSVCKYYTQSIHECPCCTDSSGILLKQCKQQFFIGQQLGKLVKYLIHVCFRTDQVFKEISLIILSLLIWNYTTVLEWCCGTSCICLC